MKHEELRTAKFVLDRLFEKYHTMFDESGEKKSVYSYDELKTMQIRPYTDGDSCGAEGGEGR